MTKYFFILFVIFFITETDASEKKKIIKNLKNIQNLNFNFEQSIKGKIEKGNCTIEYPKKIFCKYKGSKNKILVSNGSSLIIKTNESYYRYPLKKTPLNLILDKDFLIKKITTLEKRLINKTFIDYAITENDYKINIFFDKKTYNLKGWQMLDVYKNLNITFISSTKKNQNIPDNLFNLPTQD